MVWHRRARTAISDIDALLVHAERLLDAEQRGGGEQVGRGDGNHRRNERDSIECKEYGFGRSGCVHRNAFVKNGPVQI